MTVYDWEKLAKDLEELGWYGAYGYYWKRGTHPYQNAVSLVEAAAKEGLLPQNYPRFSCLVDGAL